MRRTLPALLTVAACACGGSAPRSETAGAREPPGSAEDYAERVERMEQELAARLGSDVAGDLVERDMVRPQGESLVQSLEPAPAPSSAPGSVPDCPAASELRDRICELAERICAIAGRDAADADLQSKCESARGACERARADVAARCDD